MELNKPIKRTFEAKKYPFGSIERKRLNESCLTSEYMPSYKYAVYYGGQGIVETFITKKEAEDFIKTEVAEYEKNKKLSLKEMIAKGII